MREIPAGALGKEIIIDIHDCDVETFTKSSLEKFFIDLCIQIDMTRTELFFWEYLEDENKDPEEFHHLKGISGVQFLVTSNATIHTFDNEGKVSLNVYSCKNFDEAKAEEFCANYFKGKVVNSTTIIRY